jgi:hypothetical protein
MPVNPFKFLDAQNGKVDLSRFDLNTNKTLDANESTPEWLAAINGLTADPNGDPAPTVTQPSANGGSTVPPSEAAKVPNPQVTKDNADNQREQQEADNYATGISIQNAEDKLKNNSGMDIAAGMLKEGEKRGQLFKS